MKLKTDHWGYNLTGSWKVSRHIKESILCENCQGSAWIDAGPFSCDGEGQVCHSCKGQGRFVNPELEKKPEICPVLTQMLRDTLKAYEALPEGSEFRLGVIKEGIGPRRNLRGDY